jgi:hypothetical protein
LLFTRLRRSHLLGLYFLTFFPPPPPSLPFTTCPPT